MVGVSPRELSVRENVPGKRRYREARPWASSPTLAVCTARRLGIQVQDGRGSARQVDRWNGLLRQDQENRLQAAEVCGGLRR